MQEDLIYYDTVYFRTCYFEQLAWLVLSMPFSLMQRLLESRALVFVHDPYLLLPPSAIETDDGSRTVSVPYTLELIGHSPGDKAFYILEHLRPQGYEKKHITRIVDLVQDSLVQMREEDMKQVKEASERDIFNPKFMHSFATAIARSARADIMSSIEEGDTLYLLDNLYGPDGILITANLHLATLARLRDIHIHGPRVIQNALLFKLRALGRRPAGHADVQQNLTILFRVLDAPNVRQLYTRGLIAYKNLWEYRAAATEFRAWLHNAVEAGSDDVRTHEKLLKAYLQSVEQVSPINRLPLKTLRFLITNVPGFIPGVGSIISLGLSALDTYLLEHLVGGWRPKMFVDRLRRARER